MKMKYITFIVSDIQKSSKFYQEQLELEKIEEYTKEGEYSMVMLSDGENVLELIENNEESKINSIGFEVDDLKESIKKLEEENINFLYKPEKEGDLQFVSFMDYDGMIINLSQKQ